MLLVLQTASFGMLGALFCATGSPRLGAAQLALAVVNVLIYA